MIYQESDQAKYDRSVYLRNGLLQGIDRRLRLAQKRGSQYPEKTAFEPFVLLSPSFKLPLTGKLVEFVNQIYSGVNVRIRKVEAGLSFIDVEVESEGKVEGLFETGFRLGIIPIMDREIALRNHTYIFPNKIPMTYGVQEFTLGEWVKSGMLPINYTFAEKEIDLDVVEEIINPILGSTSGFRGVLFKRKTATTSPTYLVPQHKGTSIVLRTPFREEIHLQGNKINS